MAIERFGPFTLDRARRRLAADGRPVALNDRQLDVLLMLTSQPGTIMSKDALIEAAWNGIAVADVSLYMAVKGLRDTLGAMPDGQPYIETLSRRGYRFASPIEPVGQEDRHIVRRDAAPAVAIAADRASTASVPESAQSDDPSVEDSIAIAQRLEPYQTFLDGRAALERLDVAELTRARETFAHVSRQQPALTAAHIGLASACVLQYEATRADANPDRHLLADAERHARHACTLAPGDADAWSTLALVYHRLPPGSVEGNAERYDPATMAVAAARKAVSLDSKEWRHQLRLAFVAGGAERLRAAHRVLDLRPGLALAHWLAATVFVGRQAFGVALDHVRAGCAAQDAQVEHGVGFAAVGLHLLHGMLLARDEALDAAHAALARELETAPPSHIYAREACANAWYCRGALHLRAGDAEQARRAFAAALQYLPSHPLASAWPGDGVSAPPSSAASLPHVIAGAARLSAEGRHEDAARLCEGALMASRIGPGAAWILPVEPLIHVAAHPRVWAHALALLQQLAS